MFRTDFRGFNNSLASTVSLFLPLCYTGRQTLQAVE